MRRTTTTARHAARPRLAAAAIAGLTLACGLALSTAPRVRYEGEGDHRARMDAMEGHPAPEGAFDKLSDFTTDSGYDAKSFEGIVTVVATVDASDRRSLSIVRTLERLHDRFGEDGLRVLVVHPDAGWSAFTERVDRGLVEIPAARDSGDAFMSAMGTDDHPDVYIFDRSGALRYADVENSSVAPAVVDLLKETTEEAAKAASALRARGLEAPAGTGKSNAEKDGAPAINSPADVPAAKYANAPWPEHNQGLDNDFQGKKLPAGMERVTWITDRPDEANLSRRVMVLDFWATWCGPCLRAAPTVTKVQEDHEGEVNVIGISGMPRRGYPEDPNAIREFIALNGEHYMHANDLTKALATNLQVRGIPHVVVVSTDGVIRWQGNPLDPSFPSKVEEVVAADPYLEAMRNPESTGSSAKKDAEQAKKVEWPEPNTGRLYAARDVQGTELDDPYAGLEWLDGSAPPEGDGLTIIEFWATWCTRCPALREQLNTISSKHGEDVSVVSISGMARTSQPETIETVREYLDANTSTAHHAYDPDQRLYTQIGAQSPPYVLVLDGSGVVRWQGFPSSIDFPALVDTLVEANNAANE